MRIFCLTLIALIAFAANSVLARLGLTIGEIGPWSFSLIRLISGAVMLALLIGFKAGRVEGFFNRLKISLTQSSWRGAIALLIYAGFFSYAYISLPAGTGALILFAMVQVTMLGGGLIIGERLSALQWAGSALAMGGLVYLLTPNIAPPSPIGAFAMSLSGIGWGVYSLLGRRVKLGPKSKSGPQHGPTSQTAGNFLRAALLAIFLSGPILMVSPEAMPAAKGTGFAIASGAITSGLGYAIWYMALKSLPSTRAGIAQLAVPPLAAFGGILFLNEPISLRFIIAATLIFSGIILATLLPKGPHKAAKS